MASPPSEEVLQEKVAVQENTDPKLVTELPKGIHSEWSVSRYYRRPHRHTASYSVCQRRGTTFASKFARMSKRIERWESLKYACKKTRYSLIAVRTILVLYGVFRIYNFWFLEGRTCWSNRNRRHFDERDFAESSSGTRLRRVIVLPLGLRLIVNGNSAIG